MEVLKFGKDKEEKHATLNTLAANKDNGEEKATSFKCFRCDTLDHRAYEYLEKKIKVQLAKGESEEENKKQDPPIYNEEMEEWYVCDPL